MSYNILAQNLLEDNIYLYKESDEHTLDWKNRSKKLLLEIKELKAEVMLIFTSQLTVNNSILYNKLQLFVSKLKGPFIIL